MFKPEPMVRFRIEIPTDKEDELLRKLGEQGIAEIIQLIPRPVRKTTLESECERFLRLSEKINANILKIPQPRVEKSFMSKILGRREGYTQPKPADLDIRLSPDDISGSISRIEGVFENFSSEAERLLEEYERVQETLRVLSILKDNGIDVGDIGEHRFMFVKAGLLYRKLLPIFEAYLEGKLALQPTREIGVDADRERILRISKQLDKTAKSLLEKSANILGPQQTSQISKEPADLDIRLSPDDISGSISRIEGVFENFSSEAERLLEEYERVQETLRVLSILKDNGIDVGDIGEHRFMFVKAGLLYRKLLPKLEVYIEGRVTEFVKIPWDASYYFVVIVGVKGEEEYVGEVLKLLNFEEIRLPDGLPSKTDDAIAELRRREAEIKSKLGETLRRLLGLKAQVEKFKPIILKTLKIEREKAKLWRENGKTVIHGWIPRRRSKDLERIVLDVTNRKESILIKDPIPEITPPIIVKNKSPLKDFQLLVNLRGSPNYYELNPTPLVTVLYPIMFGMMFGDLGQGLVFLLIGILLKLSHASIFGLSKHSINRLGGVLAMCGASSMFFGLLYGEFFLMEAFHPLLLSPLHELNKIMAIALAFGVIEIFIGIILGFINQLKQEHKWEAVFGAQGIAGLVYYSAGVMLGVKFLKEGMDIGVFMRNPFLTGTALTCLMIIFVHPVVEALVEGHGEIEDRLMTGFSHALETFMSYLANSVSYIRLAAFAMAHGALAVAASGLAELTGAFGYIFVNILVIVFEGLASLIQSMRLMYYEFFTKFYSGDGRPFRPFKL